MVIEIMVIEMPLMASLLLYLDRKQRTMQIWQKKQRFINLCTLQLGHCSNSWVINAYFTWNSLNRIWGSKSAKTFIENTKSAIIIYFGLPKCEWYSVSQFLTSKSTDSNIKLNNDDSWKERILHFWLVWQFIPAFS